MKRVLFLLAVGTLVLSAADTIVASKHNLSSTGAFGAASAEKQVCKFCHTPHGAANGTAEQVPLWGHDTTTVDYSAHGITSGAATNGSGSTIACLSCHDGSVAINANTNVLVKDTSEVALGALTTNAVWGTDGKMVAEKSKADLGAQHPVNVAYPMAASYMKAFSAMTVSPFPAFFAPDNSTIRTPSTYTGTTAYVQCSSCHSVHGSTINSGQFMLRVTTDGSALCLSCHRK